MNRVIAVVGAPGTGKSTLTDRLCAIEGNPAPPASATGIRVAEFTYLGDNWTAIDCPGSIEFLQDSVDALLVADAAVICVPPDPEAAVLSAPYLRVLEQAGTPSYVFVNKIDDAQGRVRDIVAALQDYANHTMVLRQVPMRDGENVVGAIDLVSERAWKYRDGEPSALVQIPEDLRDREAEARSELLESLSDYDDWLLEEIIEDHEPAQGPLYSICARVLQENRVMPVLIGAAERANGLNRLMKALRHETPGPEALRDRLAESAGADAPILAAGFHGEHRKHVGRTVFLRAFSGDLKPSATLAGGHLGSFVSAATGKALEGEALQPGAVVGAVKSDHLETGKLYTQDANLPGPDWLKGMRGEYERLLLPASEKDEVKLSSTLAKVAADDRSIEVGQDPESGAMRVACPGPLRLRVLREQLQEVFGLATEEAPVPPVYREAITKPVDVHYRHRKQTGGAGQFADVRMTVKPNPRGEGFSFEEVVKGGAVPRNYIPAVENGARDAMAKGPLGFPVVDVHVILTDGQHHSVDSSDMAFRIAGRMGVQQALADASPVLLQPIFLVKFYIPSIFTGGLVPIVSSLKGQVLGYDRDETAKGWDVFRALLPGSALDDLAGQLRSVTQGVGRFSAEFDHYQELYGKEAERITEERAQELARA
ncbi:MAG: elongation factor G [Alphaproteobacteria bacterium]|nr:MAG: elongation factor G [Alphaproteobacteria bacterium]